MPEQDTATYSRTIDETLSPNSVKVLQKRYLRKDDDGNPIERPSDMFVRVAENIASAEAAIGASPEQVAEVARDFYDLMTSLEFLPNSPTLMNAGRELQQLSACFVLPVARLDGVDLRRGPGHRDHPQVRRRHRLLVLAAAARRATRFARRRA